jgi:hypothetical protein
MASLFAGFSFAFSVTFWIQSSKVEVHALQMFIFALIIYFSLKTYIVIELKQSNKHLYYFYKWWLVFLLIGFGFSNHLMTVYLVPGTILLYFLRNNVNSKSIINLFYLGFLTFVVSFIFYLGMMYRANTAAGNAYMFGTPSDIIKILEYVSGHHYSYLMFSGMASFYKQFTLFVNYLSFDFSREYFVGGEFSISNVFIIIGFFISLLLYRRFFYYSVLTIIFSLLIAFNYNILDIEEYFLLSFLFFSLFIGLSINFLLSLCQNKQFIKVVSIVLLTFILFSQMFLNYKGVDNSNNYFYYDYPKAIIGSLNQNSIIVDGETAEIYSQYTFFNNYLNFRKDTYVVIINMLRSFTINTDTGIKVFSFEEMSRLLNYYVTPKVFKNYILTGKFKLDQNAYVIPDVLCYRIVRDHSYYAAANPDFIIRETKNTIYSKNKILFEIAEVLEKRINYELAFNKVDRALIYYLKIVKDFPDYTLAGKTLKKLSMLK